MAKHLKTEFLGLCRYLQGPHLVARFQRTCGVQGTFQRRSEKDLRQKSRSVQEDCSPALLNGAPQPTARSECSLPETDSRSTSKPLRKNSLTGDVGQEFIIENKLLFYLFTFGTELGNEMFFIIFFPFLYWNVDACVSRRLIVVWELILYLGQCAKDLVRWTRPASPPVVKVEVFYNTEYSMPSTHAMTGTALPLSLLLLTYGRWQYPFVFGLCLVVCWSLLVCISRIYMGMHSVLTGKLDLVMCWTVFTIHYSTFLSEVEQFPYQTVTLQVRMLIMEVIAGFLYSLLILTVFYPALHAIDHFYLTHRYAPLVIVLLHVGFGLLAFSLDTWSTSRGDTAQALGTAMGAALASHLNHQLGLMPDPPMSQLPFSTPPLSSALLCRSLLRLLLGVAVLLATRALMKALTIPLVCGIFGIPCDDVRKARQHMEVELPYRYIVYGTVGFSCIFLVPLLFVWLNLS